MADREPGGAAGKAAVGDKRARFSKALRFDVARRIEHLLHAGTAARAFVADHHDVTGTDFSAENAGDRGVLTFEHAGSTGKIEDARVNTGGLHDAAVLSQISIENGETSILAEGVVDLADDASLAVDVDVLVPPLLTEWNVVGTPPGAAR